jgi:hypothetical protein
MNIFQGYPMTVAASSSNKKMTDLSVPVHELPRWVWMLSLFLLFAPLIPFIAVHGILTLLYGMTPVEILIGFAILIVLHEGIHALGWKLASGLPWSAFTFGIAWRALSPYCHCKQPMGVIPYRIGGILPLIFTGILPWLIGMATANATITALGTMLIAGAVGDIYVLWTIRNVPASAQLIDHESNAGCVVLLDA